jgi:phosphoribosylamine--glycine ligase
VFAICDGVSALGLPPARDFKRAFDGDAGPNTGGMGAFSPVPLRALELAELVGSVHEPVLRELARRDAPFIGLLYAGLMLTEDGPRVLEFNCRFGDPETQAILPGVDGDLLGALAAAASGDLGDATLAASDDAAVTIVLAARDYPAAGDVGSPITGIAEAEADGAVVFHAGTALRGEQLVTNGGRILNVSATGSTLADARGRAYAAAQRIAFDGIRFRTDVALEATNGAPVG